MYWFLEKKRKSWILSSDEANFLFNSRVLLKKKFVKSGFKSDGL